MLKIENPDNLNTTMKALTSGVEFQIVYQRKNGMEYLFRILKDGVLDCKMTISTTWKYGDTILIYFCDKDDHFIHATYELDYDIVSNRSKFLLWITERFLNGYKR